jgi:16S rRNA (cytosine1402-N4)-methyltransferase
VKHFMRERSSADRLPRGVPVRAAELPEPQLRLVGRAVKPSDAETSRNPRARSAVLRVAEKAGDPLPRPSPKAEGGLKPWRA